MYLGLPRHGLTVHAVELRFHIDERAEHIHSTDANIVSRWNISGTKSSYPNFESRSLSLAVVSIYY